MKVTDNNNKPNNKADEGEKLIKKSADHELLLEGRVDLGAEPIAVAMVEQLDLVLSENQTIVIADDIEVEVKDSKRKDKKKQLEQDDKERDVKDLELSLIHISEPTRLRRISYAVFCLKKKRKISKRNERRRRKKK